MKLINKKGLKINNIEIEELFSKIKNIKSDHDLMVVGAKKIYFVSIKDKLLFLDNICINI